MQLTTRFEVVPEGTIRRRGAGAGQGQQGGREGNLVALIWNSHESQDGWDKRTVGEVELVPAQQLADVASEYAELGDMGDTPIPTLMLNKEYYGLKRYLDARAALLTDEGLKRARDRYAVGVGVGLCMLHKEQENRQRSGEIIPDEWLASSREALGRSVLSMMPAFDELAREAGIED